MVRIGIIGASGFIGNRAIEMLHAEGSYDVCPILRTADSINRLTVKELDCRVANALDRSALQQAFTGCDVLIHSIIGSPGLIRGSVVPAYQAAEKAGVRRLIYLSSMCVHGQAPEIGTIEDSPLSKQQPFPYNTAKIDAEWKLQQLRANGSVEVVIFRPGIVFGPRSRRIIEIAEQILNGSACFINHGEGICNTVYVDNLVHSMQLAMTSVAADGQAFFVGDRELVNWRDFYRPFAEALGVEPTQIPTVPIPEFAVPSRKQKLIGGIRDSEWMQNALALVSDELRQTIKQVIPKRKKSLPFVPQASSIQTQPIMSQEMSLLQQSQYKLPFDKAEKILGYEPIVSFEDACCRSIDWLTSNVNRSDG
jgi:2-alkyl-3-oxoalkanoate reductase